MKLQYLKQTSITCGITMIHYYPPRQLHVRRSRVPKTGRNALLSKLQFYIPSWYFMENGCITQVNGTELPDHSELKFLNLGEGESTNSGTGRSAVPHKTNISRNIPVEFQEMLPAVQLYIIWRRKKKRQHRREDGLFCYALKLDCWCKRCNRSANYNHR
jgi:hypothetical protein